MYICIVDQAGTVVFHRNLPTDRRHLLEAINAYRADIVVAVECISTWYWIADVCAEQAIPFVLGHALYMKAIHGGKTKNDKIDSQRIAGLLRGGMLPVAYAYPEGYALDPRSVAPPHVPHAPPERAAGSHPEHQHSAQPAAFGKRINYQGNRVGLSDHFPDPLVSKSIEADIGLITGGLR